MANVTFEIYTGSDRWIRTTDDYGQAIWWARYYVTNCEIDGTTVWAVGENGGEVIYRTY